MHRFAIPRRRALLLVLLPVLALGATLIRPAAPAQEKEEHGGDIVFHVLDKKQKYSVLYSHEKHLSAGCKCEECHGKGEKDPKIFEKKIGANHFRMKDVNAGQFCGKCHNPSPGADVTHKAFPTKSPNCSKCHNVQVREEK